MRKTPLLPALPVEGITTPVVCESMPRKSVGADDRFNAGYPAGHLLGFNATQRLTLGGSASEFFVRKGCSGTANEISEFTSHWLENSHQKRY